MLRIMIYTVFLSMVLLFSGCEKAAGEDIKTSGFYADIDVSFEDGKSRVDVMLKAGGSLSNTVIELEEGSYITATVGEETKTLKKSSDLMNKVYYWGKFTETAMDTPVVIKLDRIEDEDANNSSGKLPSKFVITQPLQYAVYGDAIPFSWEKDANSSDSVSLSITCDYQAYDPEQGGVVTYTDDLSFSLTEAEIEAAETSISYAEIFARIDSMNRSYDVCRFSAEFYREREGNVDTAFEEGGSFLLHDSVSISLPDLLY